MVQTCPNCGSPNKEGYRFCSTCGQRLDLPGNKEPLSAGADSAPPTFAVQSWEGEGGGQEPKPASQPALTPPPPYVAPRVPSPPPPATQSSASSAPRRDLPPVELDRKGEATYAPYTEEAVRHVEKGQGNRTWLMPAVVVAGMLLMLLAGAAVFLFFSPGNITIQSPGAGGRGATPEEEVKQVVRASNEEQIKAWRELNTEVLSGTRTGAFLAENVALVEQLKKNKIYGVPVNHQLDILDVKIEGDKATVKTLEVWSVTFHHQSDNTVMETRGPDKYNETYHMVKKEGKWLIEQVDFVPLTPTPGE